MNFSAVILAGGKSSRMGRDKAWLEVGSQTLLARQIELVRELGAREVFISGRPDVDYAEFDCRVLQDEVPNAGPLAGIAAALEAAKASLVFVLAVDMPNMSADCLRRLVASCTEKAGAVPRVNGAIEPLAAFYPTAARKVIAGLMGARLPLILTLSLGERGQQLSRSDFFEAPSANPVAAIRARQQTNLPLPGGEGRGEGEGIVKFPSAKSFAERCVAAGLARFVDLPASDAHYFTNWNSPADMANPSGLCHSPA